LAMARQVRPVARSSRSRCSSSLVQRLFMRWMINSCAQNEKVKLGARGRRSGAWSRFQPGRGSI
jgi:hypothetical protein